MLARGIARRAAVGLAWRGLSAAAAGGRFKYFELLDVKPGFDVDVDALRLRFHKAQREHHPDLQAARETSDKLIVDQRSALVNKAYETLKDPLKRSLYLLEESGREIGEQSRVQDPELLSEILDIQEAVAEAPSSDSLNALLTDNRQRVEHTVNELAKSFSEGDLDRARDLTIQLRYWYNIGNAIQNKPA